MQAKSVQAVLSVLRRWEQLTPSGGMPVQRLEERFAQRIGAAHVLATSSGTVALKVALRAAGIGPGAEVVVSAYDWGAAAGAVLRCGAEAVLCDIDPVRATLDPRALEAVVSRRTQAVIVTHLFGCPADMEGILQVARRHGLMVLEDCCQALGARYRSRSVGTWGDAAAFSFGWGKVVCAGEGGMLVTRDEALWRRAVGWSQHPMRQFRMPEAETLPGDMAMNGRIHPLAAVLAWAELSYLSGRLRRRRQRCMQLTRQLRSCSEIIPVEDPPEGLHAFHRYCPLVSDAEAVVAQLAAWPVISGWIQPLYRRRPFRQKYHAADFPGAERRRVGSILIDLPWDQIPPRQLDGLAHALISACEESLCR